MLKCFFAALISIDLAFMNILYRGASAGGHVWRYTFNKKNGRNLSKVSAVSALQAKMVNKGVLSPEALDKYTSFKERESDGNGLRSTESTLARWWHLKGDGLDKEVS